MHLSHCELDLEGGDRYATCIDRERGKESDMRRNRVASLTVGLGLVAALAGAEPLRLKVGDSTTHGTVKVTLVTTATGDSLQISADVEQGVLASSKAILIKNAVTLADPLWFAHVRGNSLEFKHWVAGEWIDVDQITRFADTSGGGGRLEGSIVAFRLEFGAGASASGMDPREQPSLISVALTGSLTWARPLSAGVSLAAILDDLESFARRNGGKGVKVRRDTPTALVLLAACKDSSPNYINWEVTDTRLLPFLSADGRHVAGFIRR